jgi:hypothetical protein
MCIILLIVIGLIVVLYELCRAYMTLESLNPQSTFFFEKPSINW